MSGQLLQDADPSSYEVRMTAAAEEVLERKISILEVVPLSVLPSTMPGKGISIIYIIISFVVASSIGGGFLKNYFKRRQKIIPTIEEERLKILKKIKEKIKSEH